MPRLTRAVPAYRLQKSRGLAVVTIDGKDHYLGKHGSAESRREYERLVGLWLANQRQAPPPVPGKFPDLTIAELVLRYRDFAAGYYVRDGRPAGEFENIRHAVRSLRKALGPTPAADFGPRALKAVRQQMVDAGLARTTINARVGKIRRMFRWAVAEELIPPSIVHALESVQGLQPGRHGVKETAPVRPVTAEQVEAVLPFVSRPLAAMIQVQALTGMRPGEVMAMRPMDLDRADPVWVYRPARHKTQDKGFAREVPIGPKAQAILAPWLERDPGACVFSPAEAVAIRNRTARQNRKSKMTPSQAARGPVARPKRAARDRYDKRSYHTAIERACDRAFPHPTLGAKRKDQLSDQDGAELLAWRKRHRWHPNQLRHAAATTVRAMYGLEAAQTVLGHARADVTQIYAERNLATAREVMREIG